MILVGQATEWQAGQTLNRSGNVIAIGGLDKLSHIPGRSGRLQSCTSPYTCSVEIRKGPRYLVIPGWMWGPKQAERKRTVNLWIAWIFSVFPKPQRAPLMLGRSVVGSRCLIKCKLNKWNVAYPHSGVYSPKTKPKQEQTTGTCFNKTPKTLC